MPTKLQELQRLANELGYDIVKRSPPQRVRVYWTVATPLKREPWSTSTQFFDEQEAASYYDEALSTNHAAHLMRLRRVTEETLREGAAPMKGKGN